MASTKSLQPQRVPVPSAHQQVVTSDFEEAQLQREIDEMNTRTRNCLKLGYNARSVGSDTIIELKRQGEQLDRINERTYEIHDNLSASERALRGIESWWGSVANRYVGTAMQRYILSSKNSVIIFVGGLIKNTKIEQR